MTQVRDIMEKR